MSDEVFKKYSMTYRRIDANYIRLMGKYNYVPEFGYTIDRHLESFIGEYDIVSHSFRGDHLYEFYDVIMVRRKRL